MDDPLLVSVLHRLADRDEQLEPFAERQPAFVAEPGDGDALDQLHDKVGATRVGRAGVEDLGDVGMVHERQGLALSGEPGEHLAAVHPGLDNLQCNRSPHWPGLLGHEDGAHASFADGL